MSKTTEKSEEKDLLFAGLARTARVANIPVDIFTYFFLICGFATAFLALAGNLKLGLIISGITYFLLVVATYQEDRGIQYLWFSIKRRLQRTKVFGGYSFDSHAKATDKNIEYSQKKIAGAEQMEVNNLPYLSPINEHDIKLVNGDVFTVLKITGFPFKGIKPDGMLPKIFSNSFSIFPALKISTLTFWASKCFTSSQISLCPQEFQMEQILLQYLSQIFFLI